MSAGKEEATSMLTWEQVNEEVTAIMVRKMVEFGLLDLTDAKSLEIGP